MSMNSDVGYPVRRGIPDSHSGAFLKTEDDGTTHPYSDPSIECTAMKFKKAPEAPKRFKSAFIFFSSEKHKTIRVQLETDGVAAKTADIAKLVSKAWKNLSADEKKKWEAMARKDRARYEMEKTMYKGPWKVPAKKRSLKDPNAPKRPMSAYLAFSNCRRAKAKKENPQMGNAELSRLLSTMWKEAPAETRQKYIDREYAKRQAYNTSIATWKENTKEEKRVKRERREEVALRAVEASEQSVVSSNEEKLTCRENFTMKRASSYTEGVLATERTNNYGWGSALLSLRQPALLSTSSLAASSPVCNKSPRKIPYFPAP